MFTDDLLPASLSFTSDRVVCLCLMLLLISRLSVSYKRQRRISRGVTHEVEQSLIRESFPTLPPSHPPAKALGYSTLCSPTPSPGPNLSLGRSYSYRRPA